MTVYRVVNEMGYIEAEFPTFSAAKAKAHECRKLGGNKGHYRVEEVSIVHHTTIGSTLEDLVNPGIATLGERS